MTTAQQIHVVLLDVQAEHREDVIAWLDREHLPRLRAGGAVVAARRYRCLAGEPLALLTLDLDPALSREEAAALQVAPFAEESIGRWVRDWHGRSFHAIAAQGDADPGAELVNAIFTDVAPAHRAAFSRWYDDVHLPEVLACPGWLAARRYEALGEEHRFLALYDLADAERPFGTPQYEAAVGWDEHAAHLRGYHGFRIYRLEHAEG